jgi:hypothetical protein
LASAWGVKVSVRRNVRSRGHDLTFLLTLTITPQTNADRGHDITFLLTLTITPQVDADRGHDLTFLLSLTITPSAWGVMVSVRRNVR